MKFTCRNLGSLNNKAKSFRQTLLTKDSISQEEVESFVKDLVTIEGFDNRGAVSVFISGQFQALEISNQLLFSSDLDKFLAKQTLFTEAKLIANKYIQNTSNPVIVTEVDDDIDGETGSSLKKPVDPEFDEAIVIKTDNAVYSKDSYREIKLFNNPLLQLHLFRKMNEFLFNTLFVNIKEGKIIDIRNIDAIIKKELAKSNYTNQQIVDYEAKLSGNLMLSDFISNYQLTNFARYYIEHHLMKNDFDNIISLFYNNILHKDGDLYKISKVKTIRENYDNEVGSVSILDTGNQLFKLYINTTPLLVEIDGKFQSTGSFVNPFDAVRLFAQLKNLVTRDDDPIGELKRVMEEQLDEMKGAGRNILYSIYTRFFADEDSLYSLSKKKEYQSADFQSVFTNFINAIYSIGKNTGVNIVNGKVSKIVLDDVSNTFTATRIAEILLNSIDVYNNKKELVDSLFTAFNTTELKSGLKEIATNQLSDTAFNNIIEVINEHSSLSNLNIEELIKKIISPVLLKITVNDKDVLASQARTLDVNNKEDVEEFRKAVTNAYSNKLSTLVQQTSLPSYLDLYQNGQKRPTRKNIEGNSEAEYTVQSIMTSIISYMKSLKTKISNSFSVFTDNIFLNDIIKGVLKKDGVQVGDDIKGYPDLSAAERLIYDSKFMFFRLLTESNFEEFATELFTASDKSTNYAILFKTGSFQNTIANRKVEEGNKNIIKEIIKTHRSYYNRVAEILLKDYSTAIGIEFSTLSELQAHLEANNYTFTQMRDMFIEKNLPFYDIFHYSLNEDKKVRLNKDLVKEISISDKEIETLLQKEFEDALNEIKKLNIDLADLVEEEGFNFSKDDADKSKELFKRYFLSWAYLSDQFMLATQGSLFQYKGKSIADKMVTRIKRNVLPNATNNPYIKGLVEGVTNSTKTAIVVDPLQKMHNILGEEHEHERFDGASWEFEELTTLEDNSLGGLLGVDGGIHHKSIGQSMDTERGVMTMLKHASQRQTNENLRLSIGSPFSPYKLREKAFKQFPINFTITQEYADLVGDIYQLKNNVVIKSTLEVGKTYTNLWDLWLDLGGAYSLKLDPEGIYSDGENTYSYTSYKDVETSSRKLVGLMIRHEYNLINKYGNDIDAIEKESLKNKFIGRISFMSATKTGSGNVNTVEEAFDSTSQSNLVTVDNVNDYLELQKNNKAVVIGEGTIKELSKSTPTIITNTESKLIIDGKEIISQETNKPYTLKDLSNAVEMIKSNQSNSELQSLIRALKQASEILVPAEYRSQIEALLGVQTTSNFKGYKGGFDSKGKGTPQGDGKDKAMRQVANGFIGELSNYTPSSTLTSALQILNVNEQGLKDAASFAKGTIAPASANKHSNIVMLARNAGKKGKPLNEFTKQAILERHNAGAEFVVGDMPDVDTQFIDYLQEIGATFTIYHTGNKPRIEIKSPPSRKRNQLKPSFKQGENISLDNFVRQLNNAGLNSTQITKILESQGLTPDEIGTLIKKYCK